MISNRNNNYQDVDMSRTASMQTNLQTEFGLDTFTIPFKVALYFTMHDHVRWHSQLLRVTLLQVSKEKSKTPHEGKAVSLEKSL